MEEISKEDILKKHARIYGDIVESPICDVEDAMDEYARSQSIAFAEWTMRNDIIEGSTAEQIYNQYLQSIK